MRLKSPAILQANMSHANLTPSTLAGRADCSRQFIYLLLKGERAVCSEPLATAIAEALKVPRGSLFDRTESAASVRNSGNWQTAVRS